MQRFHKRCSIADSNQTPIKCILYSSGASDGTPLVSVHTHPNNGLWLSKSLYSNRQLLDTSRVYISLQDEEISQ